MANVEFSEIGRQIIGNATLSAQVSRKLANLSPIEKAQGFAELPLSNGEVLVLQFAESKTVPRPTKTASLSMLEPV